jgi:hypothetical protein
METATQWYSPEMLKILRKELAPLGKYMDEPRISRYLRKHALTESPKVGDAGSAAESR